jgi:hypothetical protein
MYDSDGAVEKDVALLRRRLKELPVEQQLKVVGVDISVVGATHRDISVVGATHRDDTVRGWRVVKPIKGESARTRFYFLRVDDGLAVYARGVDLLTNTTLAVVDTVEAAFMAGMLLTS